MYIITCTTDMANCSLAIPTRFELPTAWAIAARPRSVWKTPITYTPLCSYILAILDPQVPALRSWGPFHSPSHPLVPIPSPPPSHQHPSPTANLHSQREHVIATSLSLGCYSRRQLESSEIRTTTTFLWPQAFCVDIFSRKNLSEICRVITAQPRYKK